MKRKDIIKQRKIEKRNKNIYKLTLMASLLSAPSAILNSNINLDSPVFNNKILEAQAMSPSDFILKIGDIARNIASQNDLYASVMIAQAALESGWGGSGLSSAPHHNLFGIKGDYKGKSYYVRTLEDDGKGNYYEIMDNFRSYPSYAESLQDYANILTGANSAWLKSYYYGARASQTNHFSEATRHLTGRYATDTRYGSKLNDIIYTYNLTRYDSSGLSIQDKNPIPTSSYNKYTVKSGDSLYKIASDNNTSINELLKLNNLSLNSIIHPNQKLIVSKAAATRNKLLPSPNKKPLNNNSKSNYTVKPGDSLYKIASDNNISINELLKLNNLSLNSVIHPNQKLILNKSNNLSKEEKVNKVNNSNNNNNTYTIKPGDGLYKISEKFGVNLDTLLKMNNLTLNSVIHPNQKLILPTDSKVDSTQPAIIKKGDSKKSYIVKPGDSLYKIATDNNVSIDELLKNNNLKLTSIINPGQEIIINKGPKVVKVQKTTRTYTVKPGDGMQKIANLMGVNLYDLMSQNNLTKDSVIHPNQKIVYNFTKRIDSTGEMSSEEIDKIISEIMTRNSSDNDSKENLEEINNNILEKVDEPMTKKTIEETTTETTTETTKEITKESIEESTEESIESILIENSFINTDITTEEFNNQELQQEDNNTNTKETNLDTDNRIKTTIEENTTTETDSDEIVNLETINIDDILD